MRRQMPPLNACRAFESAARLGSFVRAAEELNVTPTAISHQVKVLESWLGRRLFRRHNNGIALTGAAEAVLPWLSDALERIAVGMESVTGPGRPSLITISTQPNFALKWLIPRLPRFAAAFPSAEIQVVTGSRSLDVANEDFDAAVRYLDARMAAGVGVLGRVGQLRVDPLFRADLVPVASPRLFPPDVTHDLQRLRDHTLLHVSTSPDDWRLWLEAAGVTGIDAERGPKFDSYALAIEAAAQGWGIAMGRSTFLGADLASGRLTMPFARPLPGHGSWFLLTARDASMKMAGFRRWILREAASCQAASSLPATNLPRKKP